MKERKTELNELGSILDQTETDRVYTITFIDDEELDYRNFEMVDESIYQRSDLCVAELISKPSGAVEFSIKEIQQVRRKEDQAIIFEKSTY